MLPGFTLNHGVERINRGQIGSDADVLLSARWLEVHCDSLVHVAVKVCDHSGWKGDICQAAFAVIAEYKGIDSVLSREQ